MADIIAAPKAMLGHNHHLAPKFDGKPASLSRFLSKVDQLAKDCSLSQKQTIQWAIRYAPIGEYEGKCKNL